MFGTIGSKLISFIMMPLYTLWLGVDGYGASDVINVYAINILNVATFCITDAIIVVPSNKSRKEQVSLFTSGFLFGLTALACLATIFFFLNLWLGNINNLFFKYLWLIYGLIFTSFLQGVTQQFCKAINKIKLYSYVGAGQTALIAFFSYLLVPTYKIEGYVWSIMISNISAAIVVALFANLPAYFNLTQAKYKSLKLLFAYSIPLIPNSIIWWTINALNRPVLEENLGVASLGIYAVAYKIPSVISVLYQVFNSAWLISALEESKKSTYHTYYNTILRVVFYMLILLIIVISLFSREIVHIITTDEFDDAFLYLPLLSVAVALNSMSGFVGTNFSVNGTTKYYFISSLYAALVSIACNFILIPIMGIMGAVLSILLSSIAMLVSRCVYSERFVKIDKKAIYVIIVLACALFCYFIPILESFAIRMIGALACVSLFILLSINRIKLVIDKIRK